MVAVGERNSWALVESSAIAGLITRALLHPIDTCKVITQTSQSSIPSGGVLMTSRDIFRNHGMRGLYRGFPIAVAGTVPGVALYFTSFNFFKEHLDILLHHRTNVSNFTAGFLAEVVSCIVWVPTDVVKERNQVLAGSNAARCSKEPQPLSSVLRLEGVRGLYRGYGATLASFGPFSALYFMFVEGLKERYSQTFKKSNLEFAEMMSICAVAGGAAALCSAPMDLVKVRMQVERGSTSTYKGFIPALAKIWNTEGFRGLFRGGGSRVWFAVPNTAITMSIMESIKHRLE
jgi:hypothetical protein